MKRLFQRFGLNWLHALAICAIVLMVPSKSSAEFASVYEVATHPPFLTELSPVPFGARENIVIFGPSPNIQMSLTLANAPHFLGRYFEGDAANRGFGAKQRVDIPDFIVGKIEVVRKGFWGDQSIDHHSHVLGRRIAGILPSGGYFEILDLVRFEILADGKFAVPHKNEGPLSVDQGIFGQAGLPIGYGYQNDCENGDGGGCGGGNAVRTPFFRVKYDSDDTHDPRARFVGTFIGAGALFLTFAGFFYLYLRWRDMS
jgi:hypothetical protein